MIQSLQKLDAYFPHFCEKLLLKLGKIFQEMSNKRSYVRTEVGGLVKNAMILSERTVWITPLD